MDLNRWFVYEFCKKAYMESGRVPTVKQVMRKFPSMDPVELSEGISEFQEMIQRWEKTSVGSRLV